MSYSVEWNPKTRKFLKKLPNDISARIVLKVKEVQEDPFRFLEHYEGEGYKLRIGDYRALIDINRKDQILFVRVFNKRGRIYK